MCIWRNAIRNWPAHPLMSGDKVRAHLQAIFQQVPIELDRQPAVVAKAVLDIQSCRTALMGGHVARCEDCNYEHFHYHSCRNRHCPLCQSRRREQWVNARRASLLPVAYFHVVFTLPHDLNQLIQGNPRMLYRLLFKQANQTLQHFAHKYLGGRLGITMVLHTWSQNLSQHVHVHCLVTAGALSSPADSCCTSCRAAWHASAITVSTPTALTAPARPPAGRYVPQSRNHRFQKHWATGSCASPAMASIVAPGARLDDSRSSKPSPVGRATHRAYSAN